MRLSGLINWIRDFVLADAKGVALGLSGGVDSAVVAALCKTALGSEKVSLFSMPCESDPADLEDAWLVAGHLKMDMEVINLDKKFAAFIEDVDFKGFSRDKQRMIHANIKARLRMAMLYAKAFGRDYFVVGTGNKSELAIGYLTKYGDGGVDFEPIGNYYKTEVWQMAEVLMLPKKTIDRAPSAGLWKDQTDEGELGMTYHELDKILRDKNPDQSDPKVKIVMELIRRSAHKRKMPPMFKREEV